MGWHRILEALGLPEQPEVKQTERGTAVINFKGATRGGDPKTILELNVNGFAARWKQREEAATEGAMPKEKKEEAQSKREKLKEKQKKREAANRVRKESELAKGDFRKTISETGCADCLVLLETKIDSKKLMSLPGFAEWCKQSGYNYLYMTWSENEHKGGAGYAGVTVLSKIAARSVRFGLQGVQDKEARVVTLEFENYTLVGAYSPCTGYEGEKMQARKVFDKALTKHVEHLREEKNRAVVLTGDLNVNPRVQDSHPNAFLQCAKLKLQSGLHEEPGCSLQEVGMYHNLVRKMRGVNAWERLKPNSTQGMTWHSARDRRAKTYRTGQRIDHFVVAEEMMSGAHKWQVQDVKVFQGMGSSDHCPLLIQLEHRSGEKEAKKREQRRRDVVVRALTPGLSTGKGPEMINTSTGRSKKFDSFECPMVDLMIGGDERRVFLDSGSPISVYNPPESRTERESINAAIRPSNSRTNCKFKGVGGAQIVARGNGYLDIEVGEFVVETRFVILQEHEPTLPTFLLGMDILVGELEGVRITENTVRFEISPAVVYRSRWHAAEQDEVGENLVRLLQQDTPRETGMREEFELLARRQAFLASTPDPNKGREGYEGEPQAAAAEVVQEENFEDAPLPVVSITLVGGAVNSKGIQVQVLVDSGSTFNLVSRALALKMEREWPTMKTVRVRDEDMPQIRVASGTIVRASKCLQLRVAKAGASDTEAVPFYVFEGLPVEAIFGHETCTRWSAVLSWKESTWEYTAIGQEKQVVKWAARKGKHWRGAANLVAKREYIVRPGSQQKIQVEIQGEHLKAQDERGTFGLITHQQAEVKLFDVPLAVEDKAPTWMQVRNRERRPVLIKKGEIVALFHPRQEYDVFAAPGIDPSREEILAEKQREQEARACKEEGDFAMRELRRREIAEGYVRLITPEQEGEKAEVAQAETTTCRCCGGEACPIPEGEAIKGNGSARRKLWGIWALISAYPGNGEQLRCEVNKLIEWSLKWTSVINIGRGYWILIKHTTTCTIETSENPNFKARPDKTSPVQKLEIEKMIEEKLQQGIIEQSSAPWSSNCVCIRKDGKTRIDVDYRKLNLITVNSEGQLPIP
jgi:exodeoxyribonuclease III